MAKAKRKAAKTGRPVGRPPVYSKALADRVCQAMAAGESLRQACRKPGFPAVSTVLKWAA